MHFSVITQFNKLPFFDVTKPNSNYSIYSARKYDFVVIEDFDTSQNSPLIVADKHDSDRVEPVDETLAHFLAQFEERALIQFEDWIAE